MKLLANFSILFGGAGFIALILSQNQAIFGRLVLLKLDLSYLHIRFLPVRLDVLMVALIGLGFMWCWLALTPNGFRRRLELRKLKKEVKRLEKETTSLAISPTQDNDSQ